jgi:cobalt-zinc-cadmium efflux system outer membrane protein
MAADRVGVEEAVGVALQRNATVLRLQAEVAAEKARLAGASTLAATNPELEVSAEPRWRGSERSTDYGVGIAQRLEIFGQRGARIATARSLVSAAEARLAMGRVEVAAEVRVAFHQALAAEERLRLAIDGVKLGEEALGAAESRQKSGAASGIEVNAARIALGRAAREQSEAEQRKTAAGARLLLLLGMEAQEVVLSGTLRASANVPADVKARIEKALQDRPDLAAARQDLEAARSEVRLASREALPSPRVGASYREEEGARIAQGTLAFDLPVFQRNQAGRGVAEARLEQSQRATEALERAVRTEVAVAIERLRAAIGAVTAFGGAALASVGENLELVTEAYRAGKVDFFQLLVLRREALDARTSYLSALEELAAAQAELTRAAGSIE